MANYINATANLKKKGAEANPNGRPPKGYSITEWFKEMLNSKPEVKDAIGKSIMKKALEGDTAAQKMVWQYMDGMPKQEENKNNTTVNVSVPVFNVISNESKENLEKLYSATKKDD